ncbi:DUF2490 domain-containing protein [Pelagicoccus albus]|uniref:DUF2490 domain-containing protein n=1 Tax=Pelagicoccus albus TaxID=415222 RepID=A0A7X1BC23_9BACT|nr:DUF2490 domain-containing protein [Pelagicoccus albus]MBC2608190.1 DUF2490 domain-containing protein [Pelagicoccus albus]
MKLKTIFASLGIILASASVNADDFGDVWFTGNSASIDLSDTLSTKSHLELRLPDAEEIGYVRFSQKFYTKLDNGWKLGTHPTFENSKKGDDWNSTYRFDVELNPAKFKVAEKGPSISMRNRWELRWKEGKGSELFHRIRQQTKATWSVDLGPFKSYSIANEAFYEVDKSKLTINRFYPIMLGTKHAEKVKASYYLLYQSKRSGTTSDWNGSFILGASYSL